MLLLGYSYEVPYFKKAERKRKGGREGGGRERKGRRQEKERKEGRVKRKKGRDNIKKKKEEGKPVTAAGFEELMGKR